MLKFNLKKGNFLISAAIFSESTEFEVSEGLSGEFSCQARNLAGLGDKCSVQVDLFYIDR